MEKEKIKDIIWNMNTYKEMAIFFSLVLFLIISAVIISPTIEQHYLEEDSEITYNGQTDDYEIIDERIKYVIAYLENNWHRVNINGSTSMIPFHQALNDKFGDGYRIFHRRTVDAFKMFVAGEVDILFSVSYSDELIKFALDSGIDLISIPVTREAFVFLVNENNPVQNLTIEQIQGIYSGQITNWLEVGGDDAPIKPFQRNPDSGSQIRMVKFMGDVPLMDIPTGFGFAEMAAIIEYIRAFDSGLHSIGFSMYTFVEHQIGNDSINFLSVNGVRPTDWTVFNEQYPLISFNYIYFDANNEFIVEFVGYLHEFLMSEIGQQLIADAGYVNIMEFRRRNTNVFNPSWRGTDILRWLSGFYLLTEDRELLTFDTYAEWTLFEHRWNNKDNVHEWLNFVFERGLTNYRAGLWNDYYIVTPTEGLRGFGGCCCAGWSDPWDFGFKYNGFYFAELRYYVYDDRLVLVPAIRAWRNFCPEWFENHWEGRVPINRLATHEVEISRHDLRNVYIVGRFYNWMTLDDVEHIPAFR